MMDRAEREFVRLVEIMKCLRRGCPWDREQTPESLRQYIIEEAYEVVEAIEGGDVGDLREELGDLMLQVVFQSELAREGGRFDIADVLAGINEKLVRRHPHVFADTDVAGSEEVLQNWEAIKREEKLEAARLSGVPRALPSLQRAARVIEKCRRFGLELAPGEPEAALGEAAAREGEGEERAVRLGRLLFEVAGACEKLEVNPEDALRGFVDGLIESLHAREEELWREGRRLEDLPEAERTRLAEELLEG
jgi:MazG family protein